MSNVRDSPFVDAWWRQHTTVELDVDGKANWMVACVTHVVSHNKTIHFRVLGSTNPPIVLPNDAMLETRLRLYNRTPNSPISLTRLYTQVGRPVQINAEFPMIGVIMCVDGDHVCVLREYESVWMSIVDTHSSLSIKPSMWGDIVHFRIRFDPFGPWMEAVLTSTFPQDQAATELTRSSKSVLREFRLLQTGVIVVVDVVRESHCIDFYIPAMPPQLTCGGSDAKDSLLIGDLCTVVNHAGHHVSGRVVAERDGWKKVHTFGVCDDESEWIHVEKESCRVSSRMVSSVGDFCHPKCDHCREIYADNRRLTLLTPGTVAAMKCDLGTWQLVEVVKLTLSRVFVHVLGIHGIRALPKVNSGLVEPTKHTCDPDNLVVAERQCSCSMCAHMERVWNAIECDPHKPVDDDNGDVASTDANAIAIASLSTSDDTGDDTKDNRATSRVREKETNENYRPGAIIDVFWRATGGWAHGTVCVLDGPRRLVRIAYVDGLAQDCVEYVWFHLDRVPDWVLPFGEGGGVPAPDSDDVCPDGFWECGDEEVY